MIKLFLFILSNIKQVEEFVNDLVSITNEISREAAALGETQKEFYAPPSSN